MKKNNSFKVPDNYFESFNKQIIPIIMERKSEKRSLLSFNYSKWICAASVIIAITFLGYNKVKNIHFSEINDLTVSEYSSKKGVFSLDNANHFETAQNDYFLFIEDEIDDQLYIDYIDLDKF